MVLQELRLQTMGLLHTRPFQSVYGQVEDEEEAHWKLLEILGGSGQTELSYQLNNVRKQLQQP